jgi:flagellar hook assembly protein FlgD
MAAQPNPFSTATSFNFLLAEAGPATIAVYDITGRRVARLADQAYPAGSHMVTWDGRGDNAKRLPSGVYFVELSAGSHRSVKKVLLTK